MFYDKTHLQNCCEFCSNGWIYFCPYRRLWSCFIVEGPDKWNCFSLLCYFFPPELDKQVQTLTETNMSSSNDRGHTGPKTKHHLPPFLHRTGLSLHRSCSASSLRRLLSFNLFPLFSPSWPCTVARVLPPPTILSAQKIPTSAPWQRPD